jgi:hypothetical protein
VFLKKPGSLRGRVASTKVNARGDTASSIVTDEGGTQTPPTFRGGFFPDERGSAAGFNQKG